MSRSEGYLINLVKELTSLTNETGWVEFKVNNERPDEVGEYISALSNTAALDGKHYAYLIWGVNNETHEIVGTEFKPDEARIGNEELESWLLRLLAPRIFFRFYNLKIDAKNIVILEIEKAIGKPVQFKGIEFIRIGSYKKLLKDFPETERELWRSFEQDIYEDMIAKEHLTESEVLSFIDYPAYFELLKIPLPEDRKRIIERLSEEELIVQNSAGEWDITNLGAILFAKKLSNFKRLKRKTVRVVQYKGNSRIETIREQESGKGYAAYFEGLIGLIDNLLPRNEVIGKALRKELPMYPELAVRELVANALIHQDFFIRGTGPMVEIFSERMEITNPGRPLVSSERFIDTPPKSRNEALASFMRRIGVSEERGSGFDKVVYQTELYQLPAPIIEVTEEHTKVILFAHIDFKDMNKVDKIRACYLHACLKYVMRDYMTNSSLRSRFGLDDKDISSVSRIIKDAIAEKMIKASDPNTAPRYLKYVPYWA
jgi:predicted HTH transcriptional regulator